MDSFELNKIFGAILGTLLIVMGIGIFSDTIFASHAPEKTAYALPEAAAGGTGAPAAAAPVVSIAELLGKADPARGANLAKQQCGACHTFTKGGKDGIGPHLFGVVDRPIASIAGFGYSPGMQAKAKTDGKWTFEHLQAFITNPRGYAAGTKMAFGGLKDPTRLGDVIAYLRTLADTPVPLPTAAK